LEMVRNGQRLAAVDGGFDRIHRLREADVEVTPRGAAAAYRNLAYIQTDRLRRLRRIRDEGVGGVLLAASDRLRVNEIDLKARIVDDKGGGEIAFERRVGLVRRLIRGAHVHGHCMRARLERLQ